MAMKEYIRENPNWLPFVQEAWDVAVEDAKIENAKIREFNKTAPGESKKRKSIGLMYQRLMQTARYREMGEAIRRKEEGIPEPGSRELAEKEDKDLLDVKDFIDDMESPEGQFIYKFLKRYFNGFTESEDIVFLIDRIKSYYGEYELNSASDEYLVMVAISDELVLKRMNQNRLDGNLTMLKDMKNVRDNYMATLDGLKVLKKLADKQDNSKNHFSAWVDDLSKNHELYHEDSSSFDEDDVDKLLKSQRRSMYASFYGKDVDNG